MDSIFMNSDNSKTSILTDYYLIFRIKIKIKDKYVALSNLSIYYTWKDIKKP